MMPKNQETEYESLTQHLIHSNQIRVKDTTNWQNSIQGYEMIHFCF
jgi:hypothetical protein